MLENAVPEKPTGGKIDYLNRAYALNGTDINEMRQIYDEWAKTYDSDLAMESQDYVAPAIAATYVAKGLKATKIDENIEILDAGCGTGLVGVHLADLGARKVDGIDLSPGMLEVARKIGAYRNLEAVDLSKSLKYGNATYDVVTCVGTLTQGHVGPEAIDEFVRVTKKGGIIVATVLDYIWAKEGYEAKVQSLAAEAKIKVLNTGIEEYRRGAGVRARMIVLEVL